MQQIKLNFNLLNSSIEKSIEIHIENMNDCQPYFNRSIYHLQIEENNPSPFLLYTFQAFDQDDLNQISYEIQNFDENIFSINSTNGQLWIFKSFDREFQSNYSFLICAFDQIYRTCSLVYLNILDQNDNICQFNSSSITIYINENLPTNTNLIQIQAFDPDYQLNGTLFYSFNSTTSFLTLNSTSGVIQTTKNSFDYEFIQFYSIIIQSCDNFFSFPSFCCSIQLKININDLNDNHPYLIYPSDINQIFIIHYSNQTMPQLIANDRDLTKKNRLIFFEIITFRGEI
jgi:hypothetical protein